MKAVLISIRPRWCELIASGKKTIEVRKTRPKIETPFKCYIYQTMTGYVSKSKENDILVPITYGKVIGEFVCDTVYDYEAEFTDLHLPVDDPRTCLNAIYEVWHDSDGEKYSSCVASNEIDNSDCALFNESCLTFEEVRKYVGEAFLAEFYGWHISDLVIYDKPKKLQELYGYCGMFPQCDLCGDHCPVRCRPPQSWSYLGAERRMK